MPDMFANLVAQLGLDSHLLGIAVAALLTLAVLSHAFGQNPIFRLTEYLFVGLAAGYAGQLAWSYVLRPRLVLLVTEPSSYWYYAIFFALGILMLTRSVRPLAKLADLPLGIMVGTGAGLALGGALTGTLIPQLQASIVSVNPAYYGTGAVGWSLALDALLIILVTVAVLSAFQYTATGQGIVGQLGDRLLAGLSSLGRRLIMVAFGVLLAGAMLSFFALLSSRIAFLVDSWRQLGAGLGL